VARGHEMARPGWFLGTHYGTKTEAQRNMPPETPRLKSANQSGAPQKGGRKNKKKKLFGGANRFPGGAKVLEKASQLSTQTRVEVKEPPEKEKGPPAPRDPKQSLPGVNRGQN